MPVKYLQIHMRGLLERMIAQRSYAHEVCLQKRFETVDFQCPLGMTDETARCPLFVKANEIIGANIHRKE